MDNNDILDRLIEYRNVGPIGSTNIVGKLLSYDDVVDAIDEIRRLQKIVDEDASIREDEGTFARGAANSSSTQFTIDVNTFDAFTKTVNDYINEINRMRAENDSLRRQLLDLASSPDNKTSVSGTALGFGRYISLGSGHFVREMGNGKWTLIRWSGTDYQTVKENCSYEECVRVFKIKYS